MKLAESMRHSFSLKKVCKTMALVASVTAVTFTVGAQDAEAAKKIRWKVPIAFPSSLPGLGTPMVYASQKLEKATDGDIQLKIFEPGKIVPGLEVLGAVSSGKVPAGYSWLGYDKGKIPALPLFSAVPFGMEPWEFTAWNYFGGGHELLREILAKHDAVPTLCGIMGPETAGWFRKPITGVKDFEGLKIRFAGIGGEVMKKLGASVTLLGASEIYPALEKGTIDATEFSMPAIDQRLGFDKIIKHNVFPGWHQTFTAMHLVVNKAEWAKLTEGQQTQIELACQAATMYGLSEGEALQGDVLAGFAGKGVTMHKLPNDVLKKLKAVTEEVLAEEVAADADFKKVYESQKSFSGKYQMWKEYGYLPRDFQ